MFQRVWVLFVVVPSQFSINIPASFSKKGSIYYAYKLELIHLHYNNRKCLLYHGQIRFKHKFESLGGYQKGNISLKIDYKNIRCSPYVLSIIAQYC